MKKGGAIIRRLWSAPTWRRFGSMREEPFEILSNIAVISAPDPKRCRVTALQTLSLS